MSLSSWKREFYPITAAKAAKGSKLEAIRHSLKKWEGLTRENLEKHDLRSSKELIFGKTRGWLSIDAGTCALCKKYYDTDSMYHCEECPLYQFLGDRCDYTSDLRKDSPYTHFIQYGSANMMIEALKNTLWMVEEEE